MFDLEPQEARLLLNTALLAIGGNRFQSAETIISALERYRPDAPSLAEARALMLISKQDFKGALEYIDGTALPQFPDAAMLLALKGMAYLRLNQPEAARAPLAAAARQTADPAAAQLAKDLLP